jgi:ABC-type lipoprotein export system ATPase subunit
VNAIDPTLLLLLVPVGILQLGLMVVALWDLTRPGRRVRGESRLLWGRSSSSSTSRPDALFVGREEAAASREGRTVGRRAAPLRGDSRSRQLRRSSGPRPWPTRRAAPPRIGAGRPISARPTGPRNCPRPSTTARAPLPGGPPAISTRGLTKRYGSGPSEVLALDGLDLEVPTGSIFGLLGPNGAGKTTTLRLLTGLGHPTAGSATVAGISIADGGPGLASRIGYLDQDPRYYGWLTGRELVMLAGRLHGLDGTKGRARVVEVLAQVGLAAAADRRVGTYSGGMRQRLGIAQALVDRPPLVILDEPVSSLIKVGDPLDPRHLRGSSRSLLDPRLSDVERSDGWRPGSGSAGGRPSTSARSVRPAIYRPEPDQEAAVDGWPRASTTGYQSPGPGLSGHVADPGPRPAPAGRRRGGGAAGGLRAGPPDPRGRLPSVGRSRHG